MNKNSTRYYSNKQEKRVAKTLNGKKQSNSGATAFVKYALQLNYLML